MGQTLATSTPCCSTATERPIIQAPVPPPPEFPYHKQKRRSHRRRHKKSKKKRRVRWDPELERPPPTYMGEPPSSNSDETVLSAAVIVGHAPAVLKAATQMVAQAKAHRRSPVRHTDMRGDPRTVSPISIWTVSPREVGSTPSSEDYDREEEKRLVAVEPTAGTDTAAESRGSKRGSGVMLKLEVFLSSGEENSSADPNPSKLVSAKPEPGSDPAGDQLLSSPTFLIGSDPAGEQLLSSPMGALSQEYSYDDRTLNGSSSTSGATEPVAVVNVGGKLDRSPPVKAIVTGRPPSTEEPSRKISFGEEKPAVAAF